MQWMDVRGAGELRNADAYQLVADPQKRFESLWKNKSRDHGPGVNPDIYDLSPQELLEYVVQNPYTNRHWAPQHINRVPHGMLIPLENFSEHRHTSTGEVPEYDLVALMQHYEEDNWLREEALDKGEAYDVTRTGASVTT
jgi:hypothetical protein